MGKMLLHAREGVAFDRELVVRDTDGTALDISGWTFVLDLQRQAGAVDIELEMASGGAEGLEVVDGVNGVLRMVVLQATLADIDDTTGNFTMFGDLLGTPPGGIEKFISDVRLNVTTAGTEYPGSTYDVVVDAVGAAIYLRAEAAVVAAEAEVERAEREADRSELAASLSASLANMYPDISTGLAETSGSGAADRFFSVPGTGNVFATAYRNDSGSEVQIGQIPSLEVFDGAVPAMDSVASLKSLDGSLFPVAAINVATKVGIYRWDPTIAADRAKSDLIYEHRYISPDPTIDGAWVRQQLSDRERKAINEIRRLAFERFPVPQDNHNFEIQRLPALGEQINFNSDSENLSDSHYTLSGGATTLQAETTNYRGIKLQRLTVSSFTHGMRDARNADYDLEDGKLYIASAYMMAPLEQVDLNGLGVPNAFCWMQAYDDSNSFGHGAKMLFPAPRRVWTIIQGGAAVGTTRKLQNPTLPWASQPEGSTGLWWFFGGSGINATEPIDEVWLGGCQIEEAPDQTEKTGIVTLGTSIDVSGLETGDGTNHRTQSRGWSRYLEGLLCQPIFPASIGGQTSAQILARFDADIAPLREHAKYIVLCPNVNDLLLASWGGATYNVANYQANWTGIYNKALAAGWAADEILVKTIQPLSDMGDETSAADRVTLIAWIKATFRNIIDRDLLQRDAIDLGLLPPDFETDGVHPNAAARRAYAFALYQRYRHLFRFRNIPGPYQKTGSATQMQQLGAPLWLNRLKASRLDASSGVTAYREIAAGGAPVIIFHGTAGSVKTFQLPAPNYHWPNDRKNTDVQVQQIVNLTADTQDLNVRYYGDTSGADDQPIGSAILIPAGEARTVATDGTTAWVVG